MKRNATGMGGLRLKVKHSKEDSSGEGRIDKS